MADQGSPSRRARPIAILGIVAAGLVLAAVIIGASMSLGGTTEIASPDAAQPIVAGVVAAPGEELTGPSDLPPLAMVVDEPVPSGIANLTPAAQAERYATDVRDGDARSYVRLGAAEQRAGDQAAAARAYRTALAADPGSVAAKVGLAIVDAASGDAGMTRATAKIDALTRADPRNQLVWFNRGWLATYRRDGPAVLASWRRVVAIDPRTPLGRTAAILLAGIEDARANAASG